MSAPSPPVRTALGRAPGTASETWGGMLREQARRVPDAVAIAFEGRRLTYGELLEAGTWRARELRALGVGPGDRFGILLPNSPETMELVLGAALIGAVAVPINVRYRSAELAHICSNGRLRALVTTDEIDDHVDLSAVVRDALPGLSAATDPFALALDGLPDLRAVALLGEKTAAGMVDEPTLRVRAAEQLAPTADEGPTPDDPFLIMYTSGTTASPKGCVTRHGALVRNARGIAERWQIPPDDRWFNPLPMFHMGAILQGSAVLSRGGTFVSMQHFDAGAALALIAEHRATVLYPLFPTITLALIHHERFASTPMDAVRAVGSVSPFDVQQRVQDAFPHATLMSAYGMTELCGTMTFSRLDDTLHQRLSTCGHLLPGWEARVVDPVTGSVLAPGRRGELVARGPDLFAGYFDDPEHTAEALDAEGYLHTGDLCSFDEDGLLHFHGRLKDQLKVGGENVSALEVESFLATHPAVKLAQVVGVPDDRLGEVPAAFVELVPGADATAEELAAFCIGRLARFKVPRHVRFVASWPMSSTKIQKFRLREMLVRELGAGS